MGDKSGIFDSSKVQKVSFAEAKKYYDDNKANASSGAAAPAAAAAVAKASTPASKTPAKAAVTGPANAAGRESLAQFKMGGKRPKDSPKGPGLATGPIGAAGAKKVVGAKGASAAVSTQTRKDTNDAAAEGKQSFLTVRVFFFLTTNTCNKGGATEQFSLSADKSYVICGSDLAAHIPTHLAAQKGEVVMVIQKYPTGWWRGVTQSGASGIFDKKKVKEATFAEVEAIVKGGGASGAATTTTQQPRREKPTLYRVEALFDYTATAPNQLSLVEGECVNILQEADKGWLQAERPETNERGFVPASYVQRIEEVGCVVLIAISMRLLISSTIEPPTRKGQHFRSSLETV